MISDNTSNPNYAYQHHVVSQDYNPLKTTLGGNQEPDSADESMLESESKQY
jgi:hypothetical protein